MTDPIRAALAAAPPAPEADAVLSLAARPLLEQVARLADRIGQHTVGEILVLSDRAAAWLAQNPPGQPVAIEPRGCPIPGACACVEPATAPPAAGDGRWTEGVCGDGAVILFDGAPVPIEEVIRALNNADRAALAQPVPPVDGKGLTDDELKELAEDLEWKRLTWKEGSGPSFLFEFARAAIAADRAERAQATAEALQAAYLKWIKSNYGMTPTQAAVQSAAAFALAVLRGEVEL